MMSMVKIKPIYFTAYMYFIGWYNGSYSKVFECYTHLVYDQLTLWPIRFYAEVTDELDSII